MRRKGYQVTRYADDWVVTCQSAAEARAAIVAARQILEQLGVDLHPQRRGWRDVDKGSSFLAIRSSEASGDSGCCPTRSKAGYGKGIYMRTQKEIDPSLYGSGA